MPKSSRKKYGGSKTAKKRTLKYGSKASVAKLLGGYRRRRVPATL
jgi:hypothetical protein